MITFLSNQMHYTNVLSHVKDVRSTLWIGTADIKDLYVELANRNCLFSACSPD